MSTSLCDVVVPIALAVKGEQLAHELWNYKNNRRPEVRRQLTNGLAFVLANFLHRHERCLTAAAGVSSFDVVTAVPASNDRGGTEPLVAILRDRLAVTRSRFEQLLVSSGPNQRELARERFTTRQDLAERSILLVDDTWTSGASMQSAASTLRRAGALSVVGLVIGRHFDPAHESAGAYLRLAKSRPYEWDSCCCCSGQDPLSTLPPGPGSP